MNKPKIMIGLTAIASVGILAATIIISSCIGKKSTQITQSTPTPNGEDASLWLNVVAQTPNGSTTGYYCESGPPGHLVNDGKGCFKANIVGTNPPNYNLLYVMDDPNKVGAPTISSPNNSAASSSSANKILMGSTISDPDKFYFSVPQDHQYSIKLYYIEYGASLPTTATNQWNSATCSNPYIGNTNQAACYRWFFIMTVAGGSNPSVGFGSQVSVSSQDPGGFIGNCY